MFITDKIESKKMRPVIAWLTVTIFCLVFSGIYERFSHGVYSLNVVFMFLYPLLGGVTPSLLFLFTQILKPKKIVAEIWRAGIITFIVGSCLYGALNIHGSFSPRVNCYRWIGALFLVTSISLYIFQMLIQNKKA